jgi:cytochrome c oxidase cbb3-type subunit 2
VHSFSAYKDPLTGEPLELSAEDRAALNDPALEAAESRTAYRTQGAEAPPAQYGGEAWASKHGFDFAAAQADGRGADRTQ